MRLIDADELIDILNKYVSKNNIKPILDFIVQLLESRPTVDTEQVIRCRNCKYSFNRQGRKPLGCYYHGKNGITLHDVDDFCSYGERIAGKDK